MDLVKNRILRAFSSYYIFTSTGNKKGKGTKLVVIIVKTNLTFFYIHFIETNSLP